MVSIRCPVGEFLVETSTMVSSTVSFAVVRSRCRGLSAISSPHRSPVPIAVSVITRCWAGNASRIRAYSSGVRVRAFFFTTFGSSVWAHGLNVITRSLRARSKIECSMVVLAYRRSRESAVGGGGDPALDLRRQDLADRPAPEGGDEVPVEVGPVVGQGGGLHLLRMREEIT